jgi:hypothetical protein
MPKIGILAYGSLIDDPGREIQPLIVRFIEDVRTPFSIEFARSSATRDGAPTLVPISTGGSPVKAKILALGDHVSLETARNILWRRETGRVGPTQSYKPPDQPNENTVLVDDFAGLAGLDVVISARIGSNITPLTPDRLAKLAIGSARASAGAERRDGISYLMSAKLNGLATPLSADYEAAILRMTGAANLEEAWAICEGA